MTHSWILPRNEAAPLGPVLVATHGDCPVGAMGAGAVVREVPGGEERKQREGCSARVMAAAPLPFPLVWRLRPSPADPLHHGPLAPLAPAGVLRAESSVVARPAHARMCCVRRSPAEARAAFADPSCPPGPPPPKQAWPPRSPRTCTS